MVIQYSSHPLSITILLLLLLPLFFILIKILAGSESNKRLPPGPWKLPIIGNLHQLLHGLPYRLLADLANKHGRDLMLVRLGQVNHIVVSSAEAAGEIMKTHDLKFSYRPHLLIPTVMSYDNTDIAFAPYGSYWRQMRKICVLEMFSARQVKEFFPIREDEISNLVESIFSASATGSAVNLTEKFSHLANNVVSRAAVGSGCKHRESFLSILKIAEELTSGFELVDLYPSLGFMSALTGVSSRLKKIHRESDMILDQVIEEHRTKRSEAKCTGQEAEKLEKDLVDVLLSIQEDGDLEFPITKANIKAVILDMFSAGTVTTSTTMGWIMAELIRHPDVMKKVQSEVRQALKEKEKIGDEDMRSLHYLKLIIKETLRLHPTNPFLLPRECNETCNVMGYHITAGTRIIINTWAIGRDPRYWEDGASFKPERFDGLNVDFLGSSFDYMPFGGGRRVCPGMTFAMVNLELTLAKLLFHFDWELPYGMKLEDLDMTEQFGVTSARKSDLFLLAKPHKLL